MPNETLLTLEEREVALNRVACARATCKLGHPAGANHVAKELTLMAAEGAHGQFVLPGTTPAEAAAFLKSIGMTPPKFEKRQPV